MTSYMNFTATKPPLKPENSSSRDVFIVCGATTARSVIAPYRSLVDLSFEHIGNLTPREIEGIVNSERAGGARPLKPIKAMEIR